MSFPSRHSGWSDEALKKSAESRKNSAIKKYNRMHLEVKRLGETYGYTHPMTEHANIRLQAFRAMLYAPKRV